MKDIFFSIITPVLDGSHYVDNYFNSLKNQTYKKWEAIIVDDYSNDDSYSYLKYLTKNDKRFRIYKNRLKKNLASPYAARNYALSKSKGSYICFLDIDDFWYPEKLKSDNNILKSFNSDILIGDFIKTNQDLTKGYLKPRLNLLNIKFQVHFCNPFPMLSTTIKRSTIGETNFKPIHHEDYIFWREIVEKNKQSNITLKVNINKSQNALYRITKESLSFNRFKTINWLITCYDYFNTSRFIIYIILLIRILLFFIEKLALTLKIIKIKDIKI